MQTLAVLFQIDPKKDKEQDPTKVKIDGSKRAR